MGGGLVAINGIERAGNLCKFLKPLGVVVDCPSAGLPPPVRRMLNKKIMCEIFHCCNDPKKNPRQPGEKFSSCVESVVGGADMFFGGKGRFKSEVTYLKGLEPWTRKDGSLIGPNSQRGWFPRGSSRPDVVAVNDTSKPPTIDNIEGIYEFKFPGDSWGDTQKDRYQQIAGKRNLEEISESTCKDSDNNGAKQATVLATASALDLARFNAQAAAVNDATLGIVGAVGGTAAARALLASVASAMRAAAAGLGGLAGAH